MMPQGHVPATTVDALLERIAELERMVFDLSRDKAHLEDVIRRTVRRDPRVDPEWDDIEADTEKNPGVTQRLADKCK